MKTPLGAEVDLGPGHIVLDGVPSARAKGAQQPPLFGPCPLCQRSPISATAELLFDFHKVVLQHYLGEVGLHVSFILESDSENYIKIREFLTKLQTKISWLLFYGPRCR